MAKEKREKTEKAAATEKKSGAGKKSGKRKEQPIEAASLPSDYKPRLHDLYREKIVSDLQKKFNYKNVHLMPKLTKIVLNVGIGTLHQDPKLAESVVEEFKLISGQHPVLTRAKKSISNFKLRENMIVGCRVTLRCFMMYEFLDRLISIVIPRIRDFRGLSDHSFDGRGNYTFGVKEQIIFPEIDYDKVVKIHGMDITITTTARNDEEALELLKGFGFPFVRRVAATKDAA